MATIEKLPGKTGTTYRITVYSGFDTQGKRIRHRMAYKPTTGMTARQTEKAVQRAAADFERSIEQGYDWTTARPLPSMPPMCWN